MFTLTIFVIVIHVLVIGTLEKAKIWPLRSFSVRIIESLARLTLLPLTFLYFISLFGEALPNDSLVTGITVCVIYIAFVGGKEMGGIGKAFSDFKKALCAKIESSIPDENISVLEKYAFNAIIYHRFSRRLWRESKNTELGDVHIENIIHGETERNDDKLIALNSMRGNRKKADEPGGYENEVMNQEAAGTEVEMNDAGLDAENINVQVNDGASFGEDFQDFNF